MNSATLNQPASVEPSLIARLRNGNDSAYETLVREYGPRMLAVAKRFFPCAQDAADAVQDAFVSAFQSIDSFHENASIATWLHRITVNACLMMLRSRSRRSTVCLDELLPTFDAGGRHMQSATQPDAAFEKLAGTEQRAQIHACINELPDAYQSVLRLRDIEEYDTDETARVLGTSIANVKTRLHRARQMLKTLLERKVQCSS